MGLTSRVAGWAGGVDSPELNLVWDEAKRRGADVPQGLPSEGLAEEPFWPDDLGCRQCVVRHTCRPARPEAAE